MQQRLIFSYGYELPFGKGKRLAASGNPPVLDHLSEAENTLSEVIRDLTFLIQELYPKDLKEKGLMSALRKIVAALADVETVQTSG